jgi:hypothetical protein
MLPGIFADVMNHVSNFEIVYLDVVQTDYHSYQVIRQKICLTQNDHSQAVREAGIGLQSTVHTHQVSDNRAGIRCMVIGN